MYEDQRPVKASLSHTDRKLFVIVGVDDLKIDLWTSYVENKTYEAAAEPLVGIRR